jgi:hypothetical protein
MKKLALCMMMIAVLVSSGWTQTQSGNGIREREKNQQDRIDDGIRSGQRSAGEAAKLERQESRINREVRTERRANGGNLTNKQKAQVNRQLNRGSARIYNKKHNSVRGPH